MRTTIGHIPFSLLYVIYYYIAVVTHNMRVFLRLLLQTLVCSGQFNRVKKEYLIYYIIHTCYDSLVRGEKS